MNKDISYALDYHELTKHSEISIMTSRHSLDLGNRPIPFKIYTELPSISLQSEFPIPALNAIPSISNIHPKDQILKIVVLLPLRIIVILKR